VADLPQGARDDPEGGRLDLHHVPG